MPTLMDRLLDSMPPWQRRFSNKFLVDTVNRMNALVAACGLSRAEIAERAGWKESYLSRILSGKQNLTLRTIARFEEAVGGDVLLVAGPQPQPFQRVRLSSAASPLERIASPPRTFKRVSGGANDYSYALAVDVD